MNKIEDWLNQMRHHQRIPKLLVQKIDKSKGDKWKADNTANLKQKEGYKRMEDLLTEVTDC